MEVKLIHGHSSNRLRRERGIVANGYLLGGILIDAPENSKADGVELVVITHEHCDHIAALGNYDCIKAASEYAAQAVNSRSSFCLCDLIEMEFPNVKIERIVKEGDRLKGDGVELQVIETPGHAKGAICLYEVDKKYLFSGDSVFGDYCLPNYRLPNSNYDMLVKSYEKLTSLDIEKIFPGHGEPFAEKDYIKKIMNRIK